VENGHPELEAVIVAMNKQPHITPSAPKKQSPKKHHKPPANHHGLNYFDYMKGSPAYNPSLKDKPGPKPSKYPTTRDQQPS
jgi:hypothetical protein